VGAGHDVERAERDPDVAQRPVAGDRDRRDHGERGGYAVFLPCDTNARQPPNDEMSCASATASASTRKPFTARPSASVNVPIDSGAATLPMKWPNFAAGIVQTSSSILAPLPAATRSRPGFGGRLPLSANSR